MHARAAQCTSALTLRQAARQSVFWASAPTTILSMPGGMCAPALRTAARTGMTPSPASLPGRAHEAGDTGYQNHLLPLLNSTCVADWRQFRRLMRSVRSVNTIDLGVVSWLLIPFSEISYFLTLWHYSISGFGIMRTSDALQQTSLSITVLACMYLYRFYP